jgi:apolipoprotein D and lipocalin family protein
MMAAIQRSVIMTRKMILCFLVFLSACVGIPENVEPVRGFDAQRYLGTWYEIARLDHSFEKGLENVTAEYSLRDDGGIKVVNIGFNPESGQWKEAVGKAYFVSDSSVGRLKVSFFGPFYGGYNIIALDKEQYSYSLLCGPSKDYLWILARKPKMEESIRNELINKAKALGFDTDKLILVKQ